MQNKESRIAKTDGIEVTFYTDPLCCWTWQMWPHWQKLQAEFAEPISVTYKMAGLLPSWDQFNDTLNSVTKPIQMGPEWAHAKAIGGVAMNDRIWITDPPASSFPACIAIKAMAIQSPAAAEDYFYTLQRAVMLDSQNIARTDILLKLAGDIAAKWREINPFLFREDLLGERGKAAFGKDLQESKYLAVSRLPTLVIRQPKIPSVMLTGYQPYEQLAAAFDRLAFGIPGTV